MMLPTEQPEDSKELLFSFHRCCPRADSHVTDG